MKKQIVFENDVKYKVGVLAKPRTKSQKHPVFDDNIFIPVVKEGQYFIEKGCKTTIDYFRSNPDNLRSDRTYSIYRLDDTDNTYFFVDEGTPNRTEISEKSPSMQGLGDASHIGVEPMNIPSAAKRAEDTELRELLRNQIEQVRLSKDNEINMQKQLYQTQLEQKDKMLEEIKRELQEVRSQSAQGDPYLKEMLSRREQRIEELENIIRQMNDSFRQRELDVEKRWMDEKIQLEKAQKEIDNLMSEAALREQIEEDKAKELQGLQDQIDEQGKGLSSLLGNPAIQSVIAALAPKAVELLEKIIGGNRQPQPQYPYLNPAQVPAMPYAMPAEYANPATPSSAYPSPEQANYYSPPPIARPEEFRINQEQ